MPPVRYAVFAILWWSLINRISLIALIIINSPVIANRYLKAIVIVFSFIRLLPLNKEKLSNVVD